LIDVCGDDQRMLEHEARAVHGQRSKVLALLAKERSQFIDQLRALAGPGARPHRGSWLELARELGRTVRGQLGVSTGGDSIAACRRSLRRTEEGFDGALELPWPQAMRAVLVDQRARLDTAQDKLISVQY
jgi:hypothetical protein